MDDKKTPMLKEPFITIKQKIIGSFFETFALKAKFDICETEPSALCKPLRKNRYF